MSQSIITIQGDGKIQVTSGTFTIQELPTEFKKPRVCEDGHDKVIYDADFFGGPGERSCPICEKLKSLSTEKARLSAEKVNRIKSVVREIRDAKDELRDIESELEDIIE